MKRTAIRFINKLFKADKWNIGYVYQTSESFIANKGFKYPLFWLKEDNVDYSADPFVMEMNNSIYIYYEEISYWKGKGEIWATKDFDFKNKQRVTGISPKNIHLSYPYLFKDKTDLYCIPETAAAKEIGLYKIESNRLNQLTKKRVLLNGAEYVDSSLIFYNNKYWLFTSIAGKHDELYIFYTDALEDQFKPHQLNPIKVAIHGSRGAGNLFVVKGTLYRPTQNPVKCYGGSIIINRISALTKDDFEQKVEFEILPDAQYSEGLHNISFHNQLIVVDGKRTVSSVFMPVKKMVKKINLRNPF